MAKRLDPEQSYQQSARKLALLSDLMTVMEDVNNLAADFVLAVDSPKQLPPGCLEPFEALRSALVKLEALKKEVDI